MKAKTMNPETLTLTRVTKDMGATIKPGPLVVAAPAQTMTDEALKEVASGSGLNGPYLADLIVSMAAHENMSVNMFRVLQTITANPMLRTTFAKFEADALEAVAVHVELMEQLGIPNYYISPAARMTEGLDSHMVMSFLTAGAADPLTIDMKAVEAVLLGSTMCVSNTALLAAIGEEAQGGAKAALEAAVEKLSGPQQSHLDWARETQQRMALTLVKHKAMQKMMEFTEGVIAKVRGIA